MLVLSWPRQATTEGAEFVMLMGYVQEHSADRWKRKLIRRNPPSIFSPQSQVSSPETYSCIEFQPANVLNHTVPSYEGQE